MNEAIAQFQIDSKGIEISIDGRNRALGNIFIESLWLTVHHH